MSGKPIGLSCGFDCGTQTWEHTFPDQRARTCHCKLTRWLAGKHIPNTDEAPKEIN